MPAPLTGLTQVAKESLRKRFVLYTTISSQKIRLETEIEDTFGGPLRPPKNYVPCLVGCLYFAGCF